VPAAAPPPTPQPQPQPAAQAPEGGKSFPWVWMLVPVLLGLGALTFLRRRRLAADRDAADRAALAGTLSVERPEPRWEDAEPEQIAVAAAAEAEDGPQEAPLVLTETAPRPWLELDIAPERAASTPVEASLHYDLLLTNRGEAVARNIRIDARMFNAADEQAIAAYLGGPIHRHSRSPQITIPPGETLRLGSAIAMKVEEVREIEVQGRRIFVPSVAVNVAYDWEPDGEGRSSRSWLVGRETDTPGGRMGAFRLDLGPRIYRSVGRREGRKVMD
jgi:MYXO-CTERM domain-containing protein